MQGLRQATRPLIGTDCSHCVMLLACPTHALPAGSDALVLHQHRLPGCRPTEGLPMRMSLCSLQVAMSPAGSKENSLLQTYPADIVCGQQHMNSVNVGSHSRSLRCLQRADQLNCLSNALLPLCAGSSRRPPARPRKARENELTVDPVAYRHHAMAGCPACPAGSTGTFSAPPMPSLEMAMT